MDRKKTYKIKLTDAEVWKLNNDEDYRDSQLPRRWEYTIIRIILDQIEEQR